MAQYTSSRNAYWLRTVVAWLVAFIIVFPIIWLIVTSFKTEQQAVASPPLFIFTPTLDSFRSVLEQGDYTRFAINSLIVSGGSTLLGLILAVPAAFSMAFSPTKRTKGILMWMLSTKMMPAVGALVPIYILARNADLLDSPSSLTIIALLSNLPLMVWMLYTYFRDLPKEILEAARMDGATVADELFRVILPLSLGGIASTGLLCMVLAWNESFWALNLPAADGGTLATFIAKFSSPEGLFWAKLSAASVLAIGPIVVIGWFCQKQLVQGLTFGAVK